MCCLGLSCHVDVEGHDVTGAIPIWVQSPRWRLGPSCGRETSLGSCARAARVCVDVRGLCYHRWLGGGAMGELTPVTWAPEKWFRPSLFALGELPSQQFRRPDPDSVGMGADPDPHPMEWAVPAEARIDHPSPHPWLWVGRSQHPC